MTTRLPRMELAAFRLAVREAVRYAPCFSCIATQLGCTEPEVRDAAQMLIIKDGFRTVRRLCYGCSRMGDTLVPDYSSSRHSLVQN